MNPTTRCTVLAFVLALAACRGDHDTDATRASDATLPAPAAGQGAVTDMPGTPGPGAIGTPAPPAPTTIANASDTAPAPAGATGIAVGEPNPATPQAATVVEPGPDDALQVLRDYYAAIAARDYGKAWHLWSDGGRASRQTQEQFTDGFADTTSVSVETGTPGDEDAAAGQRYIEVPVTVTAIHADGSRHRYAGSYVLHRTVVDGASAEERAWRIASAKLREVSP